MARYLCPKCGETENIHVCVPTWYYVRQEQDPIELAPGNWDLRSIEDDDEMSCGECEHYGKASEFDSQAKPSTGQDSQQSKRIIGKFIPQAWINGYAVDLDDGRAEFDCTTEVLEMSREKALAVEDNRESSDDLVPLHILDGHNGPFRVEVEEAIQEYFGEIESTAHE